MKQGRLKIPRHNPKTDRIVFDTWFSEGSLKRAAQKLNEEGILSNRGKPYSEPGIRLAAIRYMIANYPESRQVLIDTYKDNGYIVEEEFVDRYMIKSAVLALGTQERVKFWLVKHGLLEKYKDYIETLIYIPGD